VRIILSAISIKTLRFLSFYDEGVFCYILFDFRFVFEDIGDIRLFPSDAELSLPK
jgi:hypothetical protein